MRSNNSDNPGAKLIGLVNAVPTAPRVPRELRAETTKQTLARLSDLKTRILGSISDDDIADAKLHQRLIALGITIDKEQLLSGQPTQILSVEERKHLNLLVPELLREAQRRGITIEGVAVPAAPLPAR